MNIDRNALDAQAVATIADLDYPVLKAKSVFTKYALPGVPAVFVVGNDGIVREFALGIQQDFESRAVELIEKLLAK